jgi:mono/diheme cytochrome c family protein
MRRLTYSLALPVRAALFPGFWLPFLGLLLSCFRPPGVTPPAWEAAARARELRPKPPQSSARLYERRCVRCHDDDGSGKEARPTMSEVPDFTNPRWHQQRTNAQLIAGILDGKGSKMPAFAGKVTGKEARDLAAYIRSFGPRQVKASAAKPTRKAAAKADDDFEKRFRELEEEFDRLKKQLEKLSRKSKER